MGSIASRYHTTHKVTSASRFHLVDRPTSCPHQQISTLRTHRPNTRYNSSYILIQCFREARFMNINTDMIVSITEANQNFSRIAKLVDEKGSAVIFKNNRPRYLLIDFSQAQEMAEASDEDVLSISKRLISKNRVAYDELAK